MANRLLHPHEVHPWLIDPKAPRPKFMFVHELQKMATDAASYPNGCPVLSEGPQKDDL